VAEPELEELAELAKHALPAPSPLYGMAPDHASSPLESSNDNMIDLPINEAGISTLSHVKDVPL
jgi:hypothetical protein